VSQSSINDPSWLVIARSDLGLREIPGAQTAPKISGWLQKLGAWWRDDETPWCGVAVAAWMQQAGIPLPTHWYRAKGWLAWGYACRPTLGAVVVFEREGGGHVGLLVGYDDKRNALLVLGGNQGNCVSVRPFSTDRVLGYRWPSGGEAPTNALPYLASTQDFSKDEA